MDDEERLEGEEEMELDEASDGEDEDEETTGIPVSPANSDQLLGPAPTPVTPDEAFHDPLRYPKFPLPGGKPMNIRRGPGRPRKERPPGITRGGGARRSFGRGTARGKGLGYTRGIPRRTKSKDDDTHSESPSPLRLSEDTTPDGDSTNTERSMPAPEEPPYFPEQWPGKVCALCNLGERSQLGQGELLRFTCPEGFTPEKSANRDEATDHLVDISTGDKSPRTAGPGAVTCRRQKSLAKCRNTSLTNFSEPVEELTIVGYSEEPEISTLFEPTGHYYIHQSCAIWSSNTQELTTEIVSPAIVQASSRRCAYCSHYGAGIPCKVASCNRYFHLPCAAASSCFQDTKSLSLFCSQHLGQVPLLLNGDVTCMQCYGMGDVSNLVMCSICGQHYHGSCVGLALLPGVRAGWQCVSCRVCQVCRQPEDVSKVMLCERCEKAYHPSCLRPIVTSIPKYGWKCKCCRVCTDCGSRTPGAGLSSRWHSHYTVCDSCYQQRNKGFSCPLCRKAYRAAAYREMVQCSSCKKFVHGTCDPEADPLTYQHRKEAKPDYEYVCLHCKNMALVKRKDNVDDFGGELSLSASQESLYGDGDSSEFDYQAGSEDTIYSIGLGKGKPFCASKIAKKRLGLGGGIIGRPKGVGKLGYQKRQKMAEFGRKRGPKAKMRGIFGVPGVGLQRPMSDSFSKEDEPGIENRLVLCSAKDKFVLTQDICVMCGAIGTDQEGCLIACAQCGQCYHPYCANVKVTKIILQKGWRCLDCTVCEGCGERNDEGRLILCDDCDISYHIYCMDPPLDYVPHGTWKCKWCAHCQTCGSNDPGFNSSWQKNYTQCGPCASQATCISCQEAYNEGDLIIQCIQCERWLHCACDSIKTEAEAEKCAEEGYICILCRPRDVPPPHLACNQPKPQPNKYPRSPPPTSRSPELYKPSPQQYLVDGVYLSEAGMNHIKSLTSEHQQTRKKRRKLHPLIDKEADIMATIESVVAGGSLDNSLEENGGKLDLADVKDEPTEVLKEGMVWTPRGDQPPPEGFSIYTTENGIPILRRKRQRNLQKLGIGGFIVRLRGTRKDKEEDGDSEKPSDSVVSVGEDKPRRKPQRRKPKTKLSECFPLYMQEAFFGKDLMDTTKDKDLESSSESDSERNASANGNTIQLSQDELKAMEQVKAKQEKEEDKQPADAPIKREEVAEDETSDTEALGDILPISGDLLDNDLVNTIMNEPDEDLAKASEALDELDDTPGASKDELTDILSPHFNLESMVRDTGLPNMDSKDIEEIFKGVLTDESQESQESSVFSVQAQAPHPSSTTTPLVSPSPHPGIQTTMPLPRPQVPGTLPPVGQSSLNSPMSFPPPSPYHSEYSNSPQFSPAFSEPPSPWVNQDDEGSSQPGNTTISYNQRSNLKMEADEALGTGATISSVLYANINHPEWKTEYPAWSERCKQILKKWRALPNEKKAPYLTQARDNRAAIRMKKTQQISKDIPSTTPVTATSAPTIITKPVTTMTSAQVSPVVAMASNQKQIGLLSSVGPEKSQEKNGITVSGTGVTVSAASSNHHAEVCAVQGPPKQLTSTSPSPSPTSTTPSSSPRPSSVNSLSSINSLAHQEIAGGQARVAQSPATPCTSATASYCNTGAGEGQHQTSPPSQQRPTPAHITISTNSIANSLTTISQPSPTTNVMVGVGPVRQLSSVDHQIRVLTPSEIMRTLPSLSQEHYDPPPTAIIHTVPVQSPAMEQERLANRDRSSREAEQERQWKQLQAMRQQQAQLQQQVIHEQRVHAIARVHRQISEDNTPQLPADNTVGLTTQLQVSTSQDGNHLGPLTSPSAVAARNTFVPPPVKVTRGLAPQSPHQNIPRLPNQPCVPATRPVGTVVRPGIPNNFTQPPSPFSPQAPQSPHDFPQSPASTQPQEHFQRFDNSEAYSQGSQTPRSQISGTPSYSTSPRNDVFPQPPGTPRPIFNAPTIRPTTHVYAPSRTPDPYSSQPPTPSPAPSYPSPRPESRQDPQPPEVFNQQPEVNRQLRDLLQRQQYNKKIEAVNPAWNQEGQGNPPETPQQFEVGHVQLPQQAQAANNPGEGTFRHPLPPGIVRPRMPVQPNVLIRNPMGINTRHPVAGNVDARIQGIDPRTRILLQRPQLASNIPQQHFQGKPQGMQPRMPTVRPSITENYDILQQQRFPDPNQGQTLGQRVVRAPQENLSQNPRILGTQGLIRTPLAPTTVSETNVNSSESSEIPDNVTAELEKLEQEGAPMVEVEGVSAILGDLGDDDDELLAEMGADFNILEYADPELDNITGGEKTNILDLDLEQVEVETKEEKQKKETKDDEQRKPAEMNPGNPVVSADISDSNTTTVQTSSHETASTPSQAQAMAPITAASQTPQPPPPSTILPQSHAQAVVVQQQMHQHVQQAAAMGRPMLPGTRLLSPDGAVGVVTSTNTVTVSYPSNFPGHPQRIPQAHLQVSQQQRLGMRVAGVPNVAGRVVTVNHMIGPRMPLAPPPPPPPPPYPGPPPPYPGPLQMGLCPGGRGMTRPPVHIGHPVPVAGPPMTPVVHTGAPAMTPHPHRRPLLLQEQPLLLEELLEQEKREQEKQQQVQQQQTDATPTGGNLLSDSEFERLRADVLGSAPLSSPPQGIVSVSGGVPVIRPPCTPRPPSAAGTSWPQPVPDAAKLVTQAPRQPIATQTPPEPRVATFNVTQLPAPPTPPENIVTEQDRQMQLQYEQWLNHQHQILTQQLKFYETEVQKLRKIRKSLNSKQRQLRKTGSELTENDQTELQRISTEQAILQKHLDASRKQSRQHGMLIQEYHSKQQQRQPQQQANEPCSPLMSPSQQSPMHSPAALVSRSPGPGNVPTSMIQHSPAPIIQHSPNPPLLQNSPGNPQSGNPGTMSPHSLQQQSPRIGTPHSQGEESPFSPGAMPSPGICPPTATRMASPQHRAIITGRLATSPGAFNPETRNQQQIIGEQAVRVHNLAQRFVRPPAVGEPGQRPRMQLQGTMVYGQRSPLGSPQPTQQSLINQQMLQRQQILQQQQQQQHDGTGISQDSNAITQRTLQMVQQRQQMIQQQQQRQQFIQMQQQQMQKPPNSPMVSQPANSPSPQMHQQIQQNYGQPPSSPMPRSPMVQQTMGSPMLQQQLSQTSQPPSPMNTRIHSHPPNSPMLSQYQPPSPMSRNHPSTSPMLQHQLNNTHHPPTSQPPSSPMPRSPMVGGSPMQIQRRQSTGNSPAMPDRPQSVENPGTPRTPHTPHTPHGSYGTQNSGGMPTNDQQQSQQTQSNIQEQTSTVDHNRGGGNPHNPMNPLPMCGFGRFGYIKLGLRGGSPMWSTKPETSKGKTSESHLLNIEEKPNTSMVVHRKTGIPQSKINSLVCADYNDFDDDSHTPPQTPPTNMDAKQTTSLSDNGPLPLGSPSDKLEQIPDTTDYDDDKTIVNTEVTLSSTAQRDSDDITVIEQFGDSELVDVISGTLESDMQEEYVLFEPGMVVDLSADSNDSLSHAFVNDGSQGHDLVQILEIENSESQPDESMLSDDDLVPSHTRNKKGLRLDIVRALPSGKRLVAVTDTPESPDQEELRVDPSPGSYMDQSPEQDLMVSFVSESEVVIIDPTTKSPEDNLSKESCSEELEKIDGNSIPDISKENTIGENTVVVTEEQSSLQKESKPSKSPPSFIFPEKALYNQIPPSSMHHANTGVPASCKPTVIVAYSALTNTTHSVDSTTNVTTTTTSMITTDSVTAVSTAVAALTKMKETISSPFNNNQKQSALPSTMASIVADAKIAAKLSQTALENIAVSTQQSMKKMELLPAIVSSIHVETSKSSLVKSESPVSSGTSVKNDYSSFLPSTSAVSISPIGKPTKLVLTVQPTSVTLSTPKMSIPDLSKREESVTLTVLGKEKEPEVIEKVSLVKEEHDEIDHATKKQEENTTASATGNIPVTSGSSQETIVSEEKKSDPLNTTDELESMLEAIHNPAENAVSHDKSHSENKTEASTIKRISPVTDDLSLVNILENDAEPVDNESKEESSTPLEAQGSKKTDESQTSIVQTTSLNFSPQEKKQDDLCTDVETSKSYDQHCLNEEKNLMEESSDDILDMLHNIISSKPEMANTTDILQEDRSRKSSLMYQLPQPLDTLPLNILQDSLMDLESESLENEPLLPNERDKPGKVKKSDSPPVEVAPKKSSPIPQIPQSTPLVVTTVAQLQKCTTTVPHLSPLSKPTELTSNVANVSHQLRTLLSSLQTNHTQNCTTVSQTAVVTMVSSVISGSKVGTALSTTNAPSVTSVNNIHGNSNFRVQTCMASSIVTTASKSELETITTSYVSHAKENASPTISVISTLSKATSAEQFLRVTSSGIQSQSSGSLTLQTSSASTSRPPTNTGISITSNAMLNAMLAGTNSAKPSIAGHRANTAPTQASNLLSSVMASSVQRTQSLQAILQVSSGSSPVPSRVVVNASSAAVTTSMQCVRTIVPPIVSSSPNSVNVTTSILQSTLSQTPTLLHSQLTSSQTQYKSSGHLPIDNKNAEADRIPQSTSQKRDQEEGTGKTHSPLEKSSSGKADLEISKSTGNSHRMEDSQNVLLKQLLQNTACATTTLSSSSSQGPSLPLVPSLEAQLARPVPPTPSSLLPPLLNETSTTKPSNTKQIIMRETSFLSHSVTPLKTQSPPTKEEPPKPPPQPLSTSVPTLTQQRATETFAKQPVTVSQPSKSTPVTTQGNQVTITTMTATTVAKQAAPPPPPPIAKSSPEISTTLKQEPVSNQAQTKVTTDSTVTSAVPIQQQSVPPTPVTVSRVALPTKPTITTVAAKNIQPTPPPIPSTVQVTQTLTTVATSQPQTQQQTQPQIPVSQKPIVTAQQQSSHINTIQPSVPQTVPHTMGHQAQASQGANAQHTVPFVEVKKEILDEVLSSGTPTQLTDTKDFLTAKEELMDGTIDDKTDLKKLKRRQYQQKRKQSQGKDAATAPQKKRSRKVSRLDEDYDTFIDNFMMQLRQLQPMAVLEPLLGRNYGVCPIFGSGDLSKIGSQKDYNTRTGDLVGLYGSATLPGISDHYNTQPFGELEPSPPQQPASTQRGFYDQEFPPLKLDDSDEKKENALSMNRDVDSPDTIVSSSSPECVIPEFIHRYPGLRLIDEESDEESDWLKRVSPVIPLISPIPIRVKPTYIKDTAKQDKENLGVPRLGKSPPIPLRENGNVTVTLTLNSQAADDIMGVLKDLANILNIAPPTGYQIVERTTTPPSQKLGLYRTKGKDGKEGAPIDIQSILNGAAKFCRHCDVVILNSLIRKKVSDLPFLSKEEAEPGDELCFCSAACYMQFALMHRTPTNMQDKAATIVDHLCHKPENKVLDDDHRKGKKILPKQTTDHPEGMEIEKVEKEAEIKIKTECEDQEMHENKENVTEEKRPKKHPATEELCTEIIDPQPPTKVWRGLRYKTWSVGAMQPPAKYKKPTDKEITEMLFRMGVTVVPAKTEDSRRCMFCHGQGDGTADGPARLLNFDVDKWVHLNCALWSEDVYETVNGALMNLDIALQHSLVLNCIICEKPGATVKCFKMRCTNVYHLGCAVKDGCVFYKNKSTYCAQHIQKNEKDNELTTLSVYRRVYVNRDENRQVAAVMHHSEHNHLLRVGSLIFLSVGQLLPHQLANFHTPNYIYPVGYKIVRFYWSMRRPNKRCRYVCSIHDVSGRPEFRVLVQEPLQEDVELRDATPRAVWSRILEPLAELRRSTHSVQLFPRYVSGEDLFGLTEPAVVRVLESLPGIETLTDYRFKYGRNPLLELPLAINPTGSARTEARLRNQLPWKRPHTQRTGSSARAAFVPTATVAGEVACPYSKQFVHSKSSQYKKMKQEWRNNVYLARSKIQGLGLYAARDLEKHTMVIEYIGEIIRTELAETREKQYEARNRGIYMFRLDEERVVDATLCGGLARYINHSCNPNCVAEIVEVERDLRIIIFAKRRISRGEELAYDYKFDIEDDQHKIACACGAPNCRKWMN